MSEPVEITVLSEEAIESFRFCGCNHMQLRAALDFYSTITGFRVHGRPADVIREDAAKVIVALDGVHIEPH